MHQIGKLKMCINVRMLPKATTTTNVKTIKKIECECCFKTNEKSSNFMCPL